MQSNEIWQPIAIPELQPYYKVSNHGRVYSCISKKVLKPYHYWRTRNGIKQKQHSAHYLSAGGKKKTYAVHVLVMATFKPDRPDGTTIDHKDRNPFNNHLDNLRYATDKVQKMNTSQNDRRKQASKLTMNDLEDIYQELKQKTFNEIAEERGIPKSALFFIMKYVHPLY